jgi:glycogen debranching enzyme
MASPTIKPQDISGWLAVIALSTATLAASAIPAAPRTASGAGTTKFSIPTNPIALIRDVRRGSYFDAAGRRAAILGVEEGRFESWIYPMKLFHDCRLTVSIDGGDDNIDLANYARSVTAKPESFTISYSHPQFSIREIIFSPIDEPGSVILFDIDTARTLTLMVSFVPDLKPMWPAGLGGQYAAWNQQEKFFVISESRRKYNGLIGSPAAAGGSSTPAHMLGAGSVHFEIKIDPKQARSEYIPVIITGNTEGRERAVELYKKLASNIQPLYNQNVEHYRKLREDRTSVRTPDRNYDLAFEWAKTALDKGLVANPDLGTGLIAGLGLSTDSARPGFGWFFGGDAFINSYAFLGYGDFETTRQAFKFLQKQQRADGKMMHELSQGGGMIRWFQDYPYGYYHADTTPLYIIATYEYLAQSGDRAFLNDSWESLKKAYSYCVSADKNDDGLMENTVAGLGASELGSLQENLLTDVFLGAATVQAMQAMAGMAELAGDDQTRTDAQARYERGLATLNRAYWDRQLSRYVFAITSGGGQNLEQTAWPSVALAFHLFSEQQSEGTLRSLASNEISTDWGTRMLAKTSRAYDPIAYNNGGVWPFLTGFTAMGEYEYHHSISAFHHLIQTARLTQADALGFSSEIWSGDYYRPLDTSVPHQLFSSSPAISPFIRGTMGLRGDEIKKQLTIAPHIPGGWDSVDVNRYRIGNQRFSISIRKTAGSIKALIEKSSDEPYDLIFDPALAPFTRVQAATIDGKPASFTVQESSQDLHARITARITRKLEIEIRFAVGIEIDVPVAEIAAGERTTGLKFLGVERGNDQLKVTVEGIAGRSYRIGLRSSLSDLKMDGTTLRAGSGSWTEAVVSFPEATTEGYARKTITISFQVPATKPPKR